ncbi:hypothetical protein C2S52_010796 [Perilla frutescens var. hirtella]|nr:hypothetical protein C2S52_010796 [Perilla frutescens var. hirtella]KAH6817611.1 hypothetical protein C2S51_001214 [Perilla frutescens var. frutescens]
MKLGIRDYDLGFDSHRVYDVRFGNDEIETVMTHDKKWVKVWINNTLNANECRLSRLIVGLDIEWSPEFMHGSDHSVATLQLSVGKSCLIYQILRATVIPQALRDFLVNPDFTFVGVGIKNDVQKLWNDWRLEVGNTKDLRSWAAKELGKKQLRGAGLKLLVKEVIGEEMDKPKNVTCSRWDSRVLTLKQVVYACLDAYLSFEIGRRLSAWY